MWHLHTLEARGYTAAMVYKGSWPWHMVFIVLPHLPIYTHLLMCMSTYDCRLLQNWEHFSLTSTRTTRKTTTMFWGIYTGLWTWKISCQMVFIAVHTHLLHITMYDCRTLQTWKHLKLICRRWGSTNPLPRTWKALCFWPSRTPLRCPPVIDSLLWLLLLSQLCKHSSAVYISVYIRSEGS